MKKTLVIAALVGLVAAPAMAALVPPAATTVNSFNAFPLDGSGGSTRIGGAPIFYDSKTPNDVYDNMIYYRLTGLPTPTFGTQTYSIYLLNGPSTLTQGGGFLYVPAGSFVLDDIRLAPGADGIGDPVNGIEGLQFLGGISSPGGTGYGTIYIGFLQNPYPSGATNYVGSFTPPGGGFYALRSIRVNAFYFFEVALPIKIELPQNFWMLFGSSRGTYFQTFGGDPSHGAPGTANTAGGHVKADNYTGSSHNLFLAGPLASLVTLANGTLPTAFNLHVSMQWTPEPATITLMAALGLLTLRRRRAR
jgi:hypothetical protein